MLKVMARAIWQGYITLGQLGIPVRLYAAAQSIRPHFVQLHEKDGSPVERVLMCRDEHQEIKASDTIRAVPVAPGAYVPLTDRELERAAEGVIKAIDIQQFTSVTDISPLYYERPFYVIPSRGGERAYALMREVFARTGKMAIAQFAIYSQEHIAALMVEGDMLMLQQLRYAAGIVPRTNVKTPPLPKPIPAEIEAMQKVVERFSGPVFIQDYHDSYAERINELVERKAKGLPSPRVEQIAPHATPETDIEATLLDALQAPAIAAGSDNS